MLAGELDVAYVGPGPAINGFTISSGKGVRVISGAAANGVAIVARADSPIQSLQDLSGKKLATPQIANTQDIAARHYLSGVLKQSDLSGVMPIPNAEQSSLMERGQLDAAWVPEPWASRLMIESKARLIAEEKVLWPDKQFSTTVVVATPQFIEAHPDIVAKLLEAHRTLTARLQADPKGQLEPLKTALFGLTRKQLPAGTLEQAIGRVTFTNDPLSSSMETMAQWTYELGFSKRPPNLAGLVDVRFAAPVPSKPKQGN
jgi:NitT/TauT family transport system substrate-binding protein